MGNKKIAPFIAWAQSKSVRQILNEIYGLIWKFGRDSIGVYQTNFTICMRSKKSVRPKNYSIDKIFQFAINSIENPMEIFGGLAPRLGFCICFLCQCRISSNLSGPSLWVWRSLVGFWVWSEANLLVPIMVALRFNFTRIYIRFRCNCFLRCRRIYGVSVVYGQHRIQGKVGLYLEISQPKSGETC